MPKTGLPLFLRLERDGQTICEASASELALPFTIGRKDTNFWRIPADDMSASGTHAEVLFRRRALWIRDLGSRNGTYVMGRRVKEVKLAPGTQVGIGHCRLIVETDRRSGSARSYEHHRLVRTNGPQAGTVFELKDGSTFVGCGVGDGISCPSILVSKRHAEIVCKADDSCWIKDCGSRNGTFVNGVALKDAEKFLRDGDVISFADCEFKFCDRNKQAPYPWLKMLFAAVVTVAVCCGAYFMVQSVFPSAERILNEERRYELAENFGMALALLDKVPNARGGDAYLDEVARRKASIGVWTNTVARWEIVRDDFGRRRWVRASKNLGDLLSDGVDGWGWNTTTALTEKHKAMVMKELLDVFLKSRKVLGGIFSESEQGREKEVIDRCLKEMSDALGRKGWRDDLPTGPLREDMERQRDALKAVASDFKKIGEATSCIVKPDSNEIEAVMKSASVFESVTRVLEDIAKSSEARNETWRKVAEKSKMKLVSSDIVARRCQTYLPSLRKILETRRAFEANCEALASLEYGKMTGKLPLPSDSQTDVLPVLVYIRDGLRLANERLNGQVRKSVEDQVARLGQYGISTNGAPECVLALLDRRNMAKAFLCDTLDPASRPPSATRTERVGEYDRMFGIEELGAFIQGVEHERAMNVDDDTGRPKPLLLQAILAYAQMSRFSRCCETPDVLYIRDKIDPPGGNKLRNLSDVVADLQEKKSTLVDSWWGRQTKDVRANIVLHAAALALDGGFGLDEGDVGEFVKERQSWKAALEKLDRRIKDDPFCVDEVRPMLLRLAIPGVPFGRTMRHWADSAEKGGR